MSQLHLAQIANPEPPHLVMLLGRGVVWLTRPRPNLEQMEHRVGTTKHRRGRHRLPIYGHAELLAKLSHQGIGQGLPLIEMPPGHVPHVRVPGTVRASVTENEGTTLDQQPADHQSLLGAGLDWPHHHTMMADGVEWPDGQGKDRALPR